MTFNPTIEILIVGNRYRPPLIQPHVEHLPYKLFTQDFDPPPGWKPAQQNEGYTHNHKNGYRAFRGHQEAWKNLSKPIGLALEDDAVPNRPDWWEVVNYAVNHWLPNVELVALHGRQHRADLFEKIVYPKLNVGVWWPKVKDFWMVGSLAYLMKRETAQRLIDFQLDGVPIDIFLFKNFSLVLVEPSPFTHDMRFKSLIDV